MAAPKPILLYGSAGVLLLVAALVFGKRLISSFQQPPSPDELASQALQADSPREREVSASRLVETSHQAIPQMRRVFAESSQPEVRAATIQGLAARWDFDSMPAFLDALDDPSPLVRARAGVAVQRLLGANFGFQHNDPPEKRQAMIKHMRDVWKQMRNHPNFEAGVSHLKGK